MLVFSPRFSNAVSTLNSKVLSQRPGACNSGGWPLRLLKVSCKPQIMTTLSISSFFTPLSSSLKPPFHFPIHEATFLL